MAESDFASLLAQLDEPKFLRLFRYLIDSRPDDDRLYDSEPAEALDLPNAELHHTVAREIRSIGGNLPSSWYFHIAHCPPPLCTPEAFRVFVRKSLEAAFSDLRQRSELTTSICGSDYYLFSNVADSMFTEESDEFTNVAHDLFTRILNVSPKDHPRFGFSAPHVLASRARSQIASFLVDLLNQPSSYYLIARDGHFSVTPVIEHGTLLSTSAPNRPNAIGIATTAASSVKAKDLNAEALSEFEGLINSPKTLERDLQAFLERHPQFLFALDERYCEIRPHLCLRDSRQERLVPDFMARVQDSDVWDVIELKLPGDKPRVQHRFGSKASAAAARGIAELLRYRDVFSRKEYRQRFAAVFGSAPYEPGLVLVIGRGESRQPYSWRSMHAGFPNVRVVSYDDLFDYARACRDQLQSRHGSALRSGRNDSGLIERG
jgi:hypothetical protein